MSEIQVLSRSVGTLLEMETKHLGEDLKQSMQMKYSGIATFPHYTSPNPIRITTQILGQNTNKR